MTTLLFANDDDDNDNDDDDPAPPIREGNVGIPDGGVENIEDPAVPDTLIPGYVDVVLRCCCCGVCCGVCCEAGGGCAPLFVKLVAADLDEEEELPPMIRKIGIIRLLLLLL
jgi:hypothetical protein